MKLLTVGSGPHYAQGWINLDLNTHEKWDPANGGLGQPDILASVYDMPFEDGEIDRTYLGHLLEHLVFEEIPIGLKEVKRVTKPGGEIMVVGPCLDKAKATRQPGWLLKDIEAHGGDDTGFGHAWTSTTALALEVVRTTFPEAKEIPVAQVTRPRWPNPSTAPWQFAIQAFA